MFFQKAVWPDRLNPLSEIRRPSDVRPSAGVACYGMTKTRTSGTAFGKKVAMGDGMLLQMLDYLGVAVFAITGGIVASRKQLDIVALLFFATLTGIGGGTLRDLLLGVPVFWVENEWYLLVCFVVSALVWYFAEWIEKLSKPLRWADAIGIAAYSVMGAAKALTVGDTILVAILMGVSTATFGGILRDTIAREPSSIVKPEIYVGAAFAGAGGFVVLVQLGAPQILAAILAASCALILRGGAILRGWTLPGHRFGTGSDPS